MSAKVAIIDYGIGNLTSVANALSFLGFEYLITSDPSQLHLASHVILPGVGSFEIGMRNLSERGWVDAIKDIAQQRQKPLLGICLGMQLFAREGRENGIFPGLNIIPGVVEKIPVKDVPLPHIGWNDINLTPGRITAGLVDGSHFYFVHSYRFVPDDTSIVRGVTNYEVPINAIVEAGLIVGTQFHPEKSQDVGMQILRNFIAL